MYEGNDNDECRSKKEEKGEVTEHGMTPNEVRQAGTTQFASAMWGKLGSGALGSCKLQSCLLTLPLDHLSAFR